MATSEELTPKAMIRKGVLEALLKVYNARGLAMLVSCPLCGYNIGEYTWTITNFEKGLKPIGLSGVQCANKGCLLHNGIIYEDEAKRLAEWQGKVVYDDLTEQKKIDEIIAREAAAGVTVVHDGNVLRVVEKDPNRLRIQLGEDRLKIRKAAGSTEDRIGFIDFSAEPTDVGEKSTKLEMVMTVNCSDVHGSSMIGSSIFKSIEYLGYKVWYVFVDWQNKKVKIMIEKDVAIDG